MNDMKNITILNKDIELGFFVRLKERVYTIDEYFTARNGSFDVNEIVYLESIIDYPSSFYIDEPHVCFVCIDSSLKRRISGHFSQILPENSTFNDLFELI